MDFRQQPTYISVFPRLRTFVYDTALIVPAADFDLVTPTVGKKIILYHLSLSSPDAVVVELRSQATVLYRWHSLANVPIIVNWFPHGLDTFEADEILKIHNSGAANINEFMTAVYIEV